MSDLPAGRWSAILVGHQWPGAAVLASLRGGEGNRTRLAGAYEDYGNALQALRNGQLAAQEGMTADDLRRAFLDSETRARAIAANALTKLQAYRSARRSVEELRAALTDIAIAGNTSIQQIVESTAPATEKVAAITDTVAAAQRDANSRAALYCANMLDDLQSVLNSSGADVSARHFAHANGADLRGAFTTPDTQTITNHVSQLLDPETGTAPTPGAVGVSATPDTGVGVPPSRAETRQPPAPDDRHQTWPASVAAEALGAGAAVGAEGLSLAVRQAPESPAAAGHPAQAVPDPAGSPPERSPAIPSVITAAAAAPRAPELRPRAGTANSAVAERSGGPLLGYGADARRPVSAPPPTPPIVAGAPGPAPTSHPATMLGQPPVVRRAHRPAPVASRDAREPAVSAAGDGRDHQVSILGVFARSRPELRWAVCDLDGGESLVVTDVAGGWIPPGIAIPLGVRVLQPQGGSGDLADLIGRTTPAVTYEPGQEIPDAEAPTLPTSADALRTSPVEELGWELSQATKWRDGLPRIAHTLARAVAAGSGYLDSEIALLDKHLAAVERTVLAGYPDDLGPTDLGNWQLLASIAAGVRGETTTATYHFAWFRARLPEGVVGR